jgi:small-conductance mechanosensitive channel
MTPSSVSYYGNSLERWIIALAIAVLAGAVLYAAKAILRRQVARWAARTRTNLDDLAVEVLSSTRSFFIVFLALYAGAQALQLPEPAKRVIPKLVVLVLLAQVAVWGTRLIGFSLTNYARPRARGDAGASTAYGALAFVVRFALWVTILLLALDNLGVKVTALVAGLGIGGIAVALALQNVLGDLFASLAIAMDKPFEIGDFISVGDFNGRVEHVGIKTTRVRSLTGEQLVFANTDLLTSRIRNFERLQERRIAFALGVTYQTEAETLARIPGLVRGIIEAQPRTRFERAHFKSYGDFSLDFEIVYWVLDPDYTAYMDVQQAINLAIHRTFAAEGIEFAYPTQTLLVSRAEQDGSASS